MKTFFRTSLRWTTQKLIIFVTLYSLVSPWASLLVAQQTRTPNPGSFEDFIRRRMSELSDPTKSLSTNPTKPQLNSLLAEISKPQTEKGIDKTTGLTIPKNPFGKPMEQLPPDDPRTLQYERDLIEFLQRRQQILQLREEYYQALGERNRLLLPTSLPLLQNNYFATKVAQWNGDIFWAPASMTTDINLQFGDEVRAVFGPIPPFDVTTPGKIVRPDGSTIVTGELVVEVDGNRAELKPNTSKSGSPLEFEHRDIQGAFVKWTPTIDKCDKPSLAGGVTPCGTASRLSRVVKGNVEWIALARKTKRVVKLDADPYWMPSNPSYALLGYIGFNRVSGEVAFFDGTYSGLRFDWKAPIVQPGGAGYGDLQGRAIAAMTYDPTFRIDCAACHDNKEPRILTPYIKQARVAYRSQERAMAFSLGDLLPELTRGARTPYRVVGSGYTAKNSDIIRDAFAVKDPTRNCTGCHGLTNNGTARFASDAVVKLGTLTGDNNTENSFRTDWALRSGDGKIHPWMVPGDGNDLSAEPPAPGLSDGDWTILRTVLENPPSDPQSLKLYTAAPAPESVITDETRLADPSAPSDFSIEVTPNRDGITEVMPREVHLSWKYLNSLGGVPERDDVRFNVAIIETDITATGGDPTPDQFPTIEQAKGIGATDLGGGVYTDGRILILKDVSFFGHRKWTDPAATTFPRQYRVDFPASTGKRYLIRVLSKRFCFDQSGEKFSNADHVFSVDVR
jgi:hypothetical protein